MRRHLRHNRCDKASHGRARIDDLLPLAEGEAVKERGAPWLLRRNAGDADSLHLNSLGNLHRAGLLVGQRLPRTSLAAQRTAPSASVSKHTQKAKPPQYA